jgi:hypothetical protein
MSLSFDEMVVLDVGPEPQADKAGRRVAIMSSALARLVRFLRPAVPPSDPLGLGRATLDRAGKVW